MANYHAPESSFLVPDDCECHFCGESFSKCFCFATPEEMADAALELEIERMEAEQIYDEGEIKMTPEFIAALVEWKQKGRRVANVPIEYLIAMPESPEIYCYDLDLLVGKTVHNIEEISQLNFVDARREKLQSELAALDKLAA